MSMGFVSIEKEREVMNANPARIAGYLSSEGWKVKIFSDRIEAEWGSSLAWHFFGDAGVMYAKGDPLGCEILFSDESVRISLRSKIWTWGAKSKKVKEELERWMKEILENI